MGKKKTVDERSELKFKTFANNLRLRLALTSVEQQDLAEAIGVSAISISAVVRNRRNVSLDLALRICAYFSVSLDSMLVEIKLN